MDGLDNWVVLILYFAGITVFGALVGRNTTSTKDFFMAGQRFPAWLIAISCIATLVGSYSFVKYSAAGFTYGLASSQTYLNDWFWMPLWMFGWLPMLYFAGIVTVPEYFARRFSPQVRTAATFVLLLYLLGYIGINLFTLGTALDTLWGGDGAYVIVFAIVVAALCMAYEFTGGQTSVIFTDLLQGILLMIVGLALLATGMYALGGFDRFWDLLPEGHGRALPNFNEDPKFNFVGVFWQDGLAGGLAFYFMNQGMLLRFLSARSVGTARKAATWVILLLMPLTAISVAGAGWIARALVADGQLPIDTEAKDTFVVTAKYLCTYPGVFGLVIAALLAALMSTADTLINASSSILVNDFYKPLRPGRDDRHYLKAARWTSLGAAVVGVLLVPIYMAEDSIYAAHGKFVATITPPMAVAILLAFTWPRFNTPAALATLLGGIGFMFLSLFFPVLVEPFAHGVPAEGGYKYVRACYGVAVSGLIAVGVTFATTRRPPTPGLTLWDCAQRSSSRPPGRPGKYRSQVGDGLEAAGGLQLTAAARARLQVVDGDIVFVDDARWWLGGLRSARLEVLPGEGVDIRIPLAELQKNRWRPGQPVVLSRVD